MEKKYEMLPMDDSGICHRMKALRDFSDVRAGDLGGIIHKESNLSHDGDCWIYDNAFVGGDAQVLDNAKVYDTAIISGSAMVMENARVAFRSNISGSAGIYGNAHVNGGCLFDNCRVGEFATVQNGTICGNAEIKGKACISGEAIVRDNATIAGSASVFGSAVVSGNSVVDGNASVSGTTSVECSAHVGGKARVCGRGHVVDGATIYAGSCRTFQMIGGEAYIETAEDMVHWFFNDLQVYVTAYRSLHGGVSLSLLLPPEIKPCGVESLQCSVFPVQSYARGCYVFLTSIDEINRVFPNDDRWTKVIDRIKKRLP